MNPDVGKCIIIGQTVEAIIKQFEIEGKIWSPLLFNLTFMKALTIYGLTVSLALLGFSNSQSFWKLK